MAFQVWLDFGSGWEDISSKLFGRFPVNRTRAIHAKGDPSKPVIGTARFKIARDTILVNRFLSASGSIAVKIQKDGAAYFLGQIRDTHKVKSGLMSLERFDVECVDALMRLEKRCTVSATWSGYSISNPSNKAASILHQLFYAAGFADAELNLTAIAITIDRFSLDRTRGETYRQIFERRILLETGFSAKASPAGVIELYDLGPASITPIATLSTGFAGNIAKDFEIAKNEAKAEAVDVSYWSHLTLADAILFEDTTGGGALPCSIPLTAGSYYPQGADATHDVRAELKLSDYEIIAVDSAAVEWDHTGDVVKQVEVIEGLGVRIRFYSATGGVITKLRIRGDALVRGDLYKVIRENVASTEKRESLELSTIYTAAAAERVAIIRATWHANSRFDHAVPEITLLSLTPGDYIQLTDTAILGSSQVLRVVQIEDGADPLSIKVLCEGASPYSYVALPRTVESGRPTPEYPPAIGGTPVEIIADRTPPSVPAGVSSSQLSTGALRVGFSASLDIESGVSHYRIYRREQGSAAEGVVAQVLEDGSGSYIVDDTSPVVGKSYEFAVSAVDKRGNESALSSWTAALASIVTDAPPNVAGTPTAKASAALMVVTWAVVNGAVAYRVERSTDSGYTWPTSFTAAANRLEDPIAAGVEIATLANYRYRIKALSIYQALSAAWATSGAPDTTGYGTYVPAAPTVSYNVAKRSILAQITPQAALLNPDGWDVQISRDQTNWYCPNLAAKVDADGWYTGALNGSLHLYEPSVKLNYLPIPTSGTPALPAEAGQGYYLRVRARCGSPATQSGWTASAILTVTPTLGIDHARAQILPEILAAISKNKINSFINADDGTSGWTLGAGVTVEVVDGLRTLKLVAPNASFATTPFEVLPDELLEFTFGLVCPNYSSLSGLFIGLTTADTYLRYQYVFAEKRWVYQDTATNRYFVSDYKHTTRKNFKTYILGSNVDISSVPAPETTDELYVVNCLKLSPGKTTASVRSGYNTTTAGTYWYLYQPQIYRVGAGKVVAANIYALVLSAIQADLGEITAGKMYSYDYVPGTYGFVIDLDNSEIHSESGGWSIFSDGTVEFNGGTIGGISFDATKLFVGVGNWGNADTPAYLDSSGFFSLLDKIKFDPTTNTLTIKSDALETEEGGGTLNHEGRSLVWRDSAQNEQARIVYDSTIALLKANPLGALVDFKGSWIPSTAFNTIATIDSAVQPYYIAAIAKSNGTAICIYGKLSAYNLYMRTRAVNGTWSAESTIYTPTPSFSISSLALEVLEDGSLYLLYTRASDKQLFEAICDSGGTWGAHTAISGKVGYNQQLFKLTNNQLRLIYVRNSDSNIVECVRSASGVWGSETSIISGSTYFKASTFSDGRILLLYIRNSDSFLLETIRALDGTWSTPAVVRNSVTSVFHVFVYMDDTAWCMRFRISDSNNAISTRSAVGAWGSETITYEYSTTERRAMLMLASGKTLAIFQAITTSYLSERTDNSAFSLIPIKTDYCEVGAGIEEVGQNSNGIWEKFSNGLMIEYAITPVLSAATHTITFPKPFIAAPFVMFNPNVRSSSTGSPQWRMFGFDATTLAFLVYGAGIETQYFAIGRHK